jgi:hypothetical protein
MPDSAIAVWENATKRYKSSYLVWTTYTDLLMFVFRAIFFGKDAFDVGLTASKTVMTTCERPSRIYA